VAFKGVFEKLMKRMAQAENRYFDCREKNNEEKEEVYLQSQTIGEGRRDRRKGEMKSSRRFPENKVDYAPRVPKTQKNMPIPVTPNERSERKKIGKALLRSLSRHKGVHTL